MVNQTGRVFALDIDLKNAMEEFLVKTKELDISPADLVDVMMMYTTAICETFYVGKSDYKTFLRASLEYYLHQGCSNKS